MQRVLLIISSFLILLSCTHKYYDNSESGHVINYGEFGLTAYKDSNVFFSRIKTGMSADKQISYYQHYEITLPKKITNWMYTGTAVYFEYDGEQIISIDPKSEIKDEKITPWKELITTEDLLNGFSYYYTKKHGKRWDYEATTKPSRTTKIFNDGHSTIILFNIKRENLKSFTHILESLKYIKSNRS